MDENYGPGASFVFHIKADDGLPESSPSNRNLMTEVFSDELDSHKLLNSERQASRDQVRTVLWEIEDQNFS